MAAARPAQVAESSFSFLHMELVQLARGKFEALAQQRELAVCDALEASTKGAQRGRGAQSAQGGESNTRLRRVQAYVRRRRKVRWQRYLEEMYGSKQLFEMLAFDGDVNLLFLECGAAACQRDGLHAGEGFGREAAVKTRRQTLELALAEAHARYNEGRLLHLHRSKGSEKHFTEREEQLLSACRVAERVSLSQVEVLRQVAAVACATASAPTLRWTAHNEQQWTRMGQERDG